MDKLVTLTFQKAGMLTTVQDKGRFGYQAYGVPVGGAMDQLAAQTANQLVGNAEAMPVLEITLLGPTIHFNQAIQIAITGADLSPTLNRTPISSYQSITIKADDILSFGRIVNGCRAYLAIRGTWQIPQWLNSYSAVHPNKEVLPNSIIKKGSQLQVLTSPLTQEIKLSPPIPSTSLTPIPIRVIAGPEFKQFTTFQIAHFFSHTYTIANNSNRMGYRLQGMPLSLETSSSMISSGIIPGTVQINNAGLPIVLMRDAQTVGGYPRIANVVVEDINRLAQLKPQEQVRFVYHS